MSYFELLGIEENYLIDSSKLYKNYLQALQQFHPDRAQIGEAKHYIEKSMEINQAYKILADHYERAKYILAENGYEIKESDQNGLPQDELEELLNYHDEIEEAKDVVDLRKQERMHKDKIEQILSQLAESFSHNNFPQALDYTIRLNYFNNLVKNIKAKIKNANY